MLIRLITIPETAERLDVSVGRAYQMAREGVLPTVRVGRRVKVDPRKLDAWIDSGGQALPGGWRREPESSAA